MPKTNISTPATAGCSRRSGSPAGAGGQFYPLLVRWTHLDDLAGGHPRLAVVVVNLVPEGGRSVLDCRERRDEERVAGSVTDHVARVAGGSAVDVERSTAGALHGEASEGDVG